MNWQFLTNMPAVRSHCDTLEARKIRARGPAYNQHADRSSAIQRKPSIAGAKDYTALANAIAAAPRHRLKNSLGSDIKSDADADNIRLSESGFRIGLANTERSRNSANVLINKMYSWRGYAGVHQIKESPDRVTLTASDKNLVMGTVTLGIDSPSGLLADEIFKDEIDFRRQNGGRVCEMTKLAINTESGSKGMLASLFHIAFIYGRRIHQCSDVFIEVNPRHRNFYERMLGFKPQGEIKSNRRVNAPACLLWANLDYVESQIRKYGGSGANAQTTRSLYPYFLSKEEEEGIAGLRESFF